MVRHFFIFSLICLQALACDTSLLHATEVKTDRRTQTNKKKDCVQKPQHAISMRGTPRYGPHFTHFEPFNPLAPQGGHIRLAELKHGFDSLNPFISGVTCAQGLVRGPNMLTLEPLMQRSPDEAYSLYARLAEKVVLAKDRSWIIFYLNPKARFHDGSPVTAHDAKATHEALLKEGSPALKLFSENIASFEVLTPLSFKVTFKPLANGTYCPERPFIFAERPILSAKDIRKNGFHDRKTPFLGTGPYVVDTIEQGQSITFKRHRAYWGNKLACVQGLYNFDKVTFDYFGLGESAFEAFKAGEVHYWLEPSEQRWVQGYTFQAALKGQVKKVLVPFNDAAIVTFLVYNLKKPLFQNRYVRKGLGALFPFEWINHNLFQGLLKRNNSHYGDTPFKATGTLDNTSVACLKGLNVEIPPFVFENLEAESLSGDPAKKERESLKKALHWFNKAGFHYHQGAMRHKKTGEPLHLELLIQDSKLEKMMLSYQKTLHKLGITLSIQMMDSANYQQRLMNRQYDLIITAYGTGLCPGAEQYVYYGSEFSDGPSRNHAGIHSELIDTLITRATSEPTEKGQRFFMQLLDHTLQSSHYMTPLFHRAYAQIAFWRSIQHPPLNGKLVPLLVSWWWKKTP